MLHYALFTLNRIISANNGKVFVINDREGREIYEQNRSINTRSVRDRDFTKVVPDIAPSLLLLHPYAGVSQSRSILEKKYSWLSVGIRCGILLERRTAAPHSQTHS